MRLFFQAVSKVVASLINHQGEPPVALTQAELAFLEIKDGGDTYRETQTGSTGLRFANMTYLRLAILASYDACYLTDPLN